MSATSQPTMTKRQILKAARGLDLKDRMDLVDGLLASVSAAEQREIDQAWDDEIGRRIEEVKKGKVIPIPAAEVSARLRRKLRR